MKTPYEVALEAHERYIAEKARVKASADALARMIERLAEDDEDNNEGQEE